MLRLDYAGCGASEGTFADGTLFGWRDDVLLAIDRLTDGPLILVGSSMGGWLMLLAALARPERIAALVGIAAAPDFTDWGFDTARRATLLRDGRLLEPSGYGPLADVHHPRLLGQRAGQPCCSAPRSDCLPRPPCSTGQRDPDVPFDIALRLRAAPFSRRADHPGQGRRSSPLARRGYRASAPHDRQPPARIADLLLPLILLLQSVPAPASYEACARRSARMPPPRKMAAQSWRSAGGGLPARQCLGLAYAAQARWSEGRDDVRASGARRADPGRLPCRHPLVRRPATPRLPRTIRAARAASSIARWALARGAARPTAANCGSIARVRTSRPADVTAARADLDQALALVPADPMAWLLSATLARRTRDVARARTDVAEAVRLAPDDAATHYEAGNVAFVGGDKAMAAADWARAARIGPDTPAGRAAAAALAGTPIP